LQNLGIEMKKNFVRFATDDRKEENFLENKKKLKKKKKWKFVKKI
jgi:hypothetical protein